MSESEIHDVNIFFYFFFQIWSLQLYVTWSFIIVNK